MQGLLCKEANKARMMAIAEKDKIHVVVRDEEQGINAVQEFVLDPADALELVKSVGTAMERVAENARSES